MGGPELRAAEAEEVELQGLEMRNRGQKRKRKTELEKLTKSYHNYNSAYSNN